MRSGKLPDEQVVDLAAQLLELVPLFHQPSLSIKATATCDEDPGC